MALTETQIKQATPGPKRFKMTDGHGLSLEVRPTGAKVFLKKYRFAGKTKTATLGEFPEMKLAAARLAAAEINEKVKAGEEPVVAKPRPAPESESTSEPEVVPVEKRFETIARRFIDKRAQEGIADSTFAKLNWNLGGVACDEFRGRDINSIQPPEILALIERIQAEDKIEKAKDVHRKLAQVFDYAVALGYVTWNPAKMVTRAVVRKKGGRHPGLTDPNDVGGLMRAIRLYPDGSGQNTRAALLLSAYCFLRSNELRGARWGEIDFDQAVWTVPKDRMKGHVGDHLVPLSDQALTILGHLHEYARAAEPDSLIFPMPSRAGRYMSEATLNAALRRLGYDTRTQHCQHGFRTTFSTNMNEQGWNRDWIERQLSHVDKDDVRSAYNKALYLAGRTQMMQAYANWLDEVAA